MARAPVLAAGGIVLRREDKPLIAVVRLRKRNEWVLPKGKLDDGETPRAAAEREVLEETGHEVSVHEFLGTLVHESGGRSKIVHYWRMEARDQPQHELMRDVLAVDWLPLADAVERLSRGYERAFLENVGPIALRAVAAAPSRRSRARQIVPAKPRSRRADATPPAVIEPASPPPPLAGSTVSSPVAASEVAGVAIAADPVKTLIAVVPLPEVESFSSREAAVTSAVDGCRNLIDRMRDWLRRAA